MYIVYFLIDWLSFLVTENDNGPFIFFSSNIILLGTHDDVFLTIYFMVVLVAMYIVVGVCVQVHGTGSIMYRCVVHMRLDDFTGVPKRYPMYFMHR